MFINNNQDQGHIFLSCTTIKVGLINSCFTRDSVSQPQCCLLNYITMAMLDTLPVEMFGEVASYLKFLDKKALSLVSRRCYAMTGNNECPDHLTWLIHLCRSPEKLHGPLVKNPKILRDLVFDLHKYLFYKFRRLRHRKTEIEELLLPYFPKAFPESMLLYYYMTVARDFAREAMRVPDAAGLGATAPTPRYFWGRIEMKSVYLIRLLERQRPI